ARPSGPPACPCSFSRSFRLHKHPTGALDDRQVDHRPVQRQDALLVAFERRDHLLGPLDLALARGEDAIHDRHLRGVDARLAAEAERAGEAALLLESLVVARVEVDDVEGWADARRGRVDDATTGGPLWRRAATECGFAFGSTTASSWSSRISARSSSKYDVSAPF